MKSRGRAEVKVYQHHNAMKDTYEPTFYLGLFDENDVCFFKVRLDIAELDEGEPGDCYVFGYGYSQAEAPPPGTKEFYDKLKQLGIDNG